jgi:protein tyrosine/serine phosphatase
VAAAGTNQEYLEASLEVIDRDWGSFDAYVAEAMGLGDEARVALSERLLQEE